MTEDLAQELASDVVAMLNSSKPYLRKKAVCHSFTNSVPNLDKGFPQCLVLYKIFLQYPAALRPSFARLKSKLEDPDVGSCSCVACNCFACDSTGAHQLSSQPP